MYHRTLKIFVKLFFSHHNFLSSVNLFYGTFIVSSSYPKKFSQLLALFLLTREKLFLLTKKPYGDSFIDWWCWLSKIYKNISQKCEIFFWNLWPELLVCAEMYKLLWVDLLLYCLCWCDVGLSHYAHHITTPPGFSGLATALR